MTSTDLSDRLKAVIDFSKLSTRGFAIRCGISQPTLDKQIKGLRSVSIDTLTAVCSSFPNISRDWLLLGEGEMLKTQSKELERINSLLDTIQTLQDTINNKSDIIKSLSERVRSLEADKK